MKKVIILILALSLTACANKNNSNNMPVYKNIRQPSFAGQFYPLEAGELKRKIKQYLAAVPEISPTPEGGEQVKGGILKVKALIVPHASYEFSGQVAGDGYRQLSGQKVGTAVIICNSHASYFSGIALDKVDAWQTPLGTVGVDKKLADKLIAADGSIKYNSQVFGKDQTLEVQLPFLQTVLSGEFKILPIYFGNQDGDYRKLAQALADNLAEDDIIIISTDMSHYPTYNDARRIDQGTLDKIKAGDIAELEEYINQIEAQNITNEQTLLCGIDGVKTVMALAKIKGWQADILRYANSGDTVIGDKKSVVGYGTMEFRITNYELRINNKEDKKILNQEQKNKLLDIARETVESYVKQGKVPEFKINDERLGWQEGAFVTLKKAGQLRGCIGQIISTDKPLWQVVRAMAIAAATEDARFSPISQDELDQIDYEVSVLSAPEKIDNWQKIELGKHGVIVKNGWQSGVFLPQVASETGWSKEEFLSQLCSQKAGLAPDCYKDKNTTISVFTAQVFGEKL